MSGSVYSRILVQLSVSLFLFVQARHSRSVPATTNRSVASVWRTATATGQEPGRSAGGCTTAAAKVTARATHERTFSTPPVDAA